LARRKHVGSDMESNNSPDLFTMPASAVYHGTDEVSSPMPLDRVGRYVTPLAFEIIESE
jgi:hypothetical protein